MTIVVYSLGITNGKRKIASLEFITDLTTPLPIGTTVFVAAQLQFDGKNHLGLQVLKIYHSLPNPKFPKSPDLRDGSVSMRLGRQEVENEFYLHVSNYDYLLSELKKSGWVER